MRPWVHSSTRRHCVFSEGTEETGELIPKAQRLPEISDSSPNFVTAGAKADQRSAAGRGASGTQTGRFKMVTELHCLDIVGILPGSFAVKSCNLHWPGEPGWRICQGKGCWYDPGLLWRAESRADSYLIEGCVPTEGGEIMKKRISTWTIIDNWPRCMPLLCPSPRTSTALDTSNRSWMRQHYVRVERNAESMLCMTGRFVEERHGAAYCLVSWNTLHVGAHYAWSFLFFICLLSFQVVWENLQQARRTGTWGDEAPSLCCRDLRSSGAVSTRMPEQSGLCLAVLLHPFTSLSSAELSYRIRLRHVQFLQQPIVSCSECSDYMPCTGYPCWSTRLGKGPLRQPPGLGTQLWIQQLRLRVRELRWYRTSRTSWLLHYCLIFSFTEEERCR